MPVDIKGKNIRVKLMLFFILFLLTFSVTPAYPVKAEKVQNDIKTAPIIGIRKMSYFDKNNNIISRNYIVITNKDGSKYDNSKKNFQLWYRTKGGKWKKLTKTDSVVSRQILLKESSKNMEYKLRLFKEENKKRIYGKFSNILKIPASPKLTVSKQSDNVHIKIENLDMKKKYHTYVSDLTDKQILNEWKISFSGENGTYAYISTVVNNNRDSQFGGKDAAFDELPVMCRSSKNTSKYEYSGISKQLSSSSVEYIIPADSTVAKAVLECRSLNIVSLSVTVDMEVILEQPVYTIWDF